MNEQWTQINNISNRTDIKKRAELDNFTTVRDECIAIIIIDSYKCNYVQQQDKTVHNFHVYRSEDHLIRLGVNI